jgi:hypothetical protein
MCVLLCSIELTMFMSNSWEHFFFNEYFIKTFFGQKCVLNMILVLKPVFNVRPATLKMYQHYVVLGQLAPTAGDVLCVWVPHTGVTLLE